MQNFFVGNAKRINNIFLVNSNKISISPYLNEKFCWANQIFVDSTNLFSGCTYFGGVNFYIPVNCTAKILIKNFIGTVVRSQSLRGTKMELSFIASEVWLVT